MNLIGNNTNAVDVILLRHPFENLFNDMMILNNNMSHIKKYKSYYIKVYYKCT